MPGRSVIGIDPGSTGAAAIITKGELGGRLLKIIRFKYLTWKQVHELFREWVGSVNIEQAFIEDVHSWSGEGVTSAFTFGRNQGFAEANLVFLNVPYEKVAPTVWQLTLGLGGPFKSKTERKNAHKDLAAKLFPNEKMLLDIADAVCIAEYGYRKLIGDDHVEKKEYVARAGTGVTHTTEWKR